MPVSELVAETMKSVIALIQDLQVISLKNAEALIRSEDFEANGLKEIFAKSRMLIHSLEQIFQVHGHQGFQLRHFSLWREAEKELSSILQCILQSFEMKNAEIVSELLDSAFPDALTRWEEVLEKEILDNTSISTIFGLKSGHRGADNGVDA